MKITKTHKKIALLAGLVLAIVLVAGMVNSQGGWVARVNGKTIDQETYDKRFEEVKLRYQGTLNENDNQAMDEFRRSVAEDLVIRELVRVQAEQLGVAISEADVDQAMEDLKKSRFNGDEQIMADALTAEGVSMARAREQVADGLLVMTVRDKVTESIEAPTDTDIKAVYERDPKRYEVAPTIKLRQIQVAEEAEAQAALARINQGEDMAEVASDVSQDDSSRDRGGEVGWIPRGSMDQDLEQAAFSLSVGGTSNPVKSQVGWHILRVEDFKPTYQRTFEEAKETIREELLEKSRDGYWTQWLKDIKAQATVEYNDGYKPLEV